MSSTLRTASGFHMSSGANAGAPDAPIDDVGEGILEHHLRRSCPVGAISRLRVAAPIAQTPVQALETLRRAKGMDGVFMFSDEGPVLVAWAKQPGTGAAGRIRNWLRDWQHETRARSIA